MTAVVDAAHQIVSIAVAFVGNEEGKGREVLVDLAAVVNFDADGHDYIGIAAHHLC